jgi:hypothetical protein
MTGENAASVSFEALMRCHPVRYAVIRHMAHAAGFSEDYAYSNISALMRMLDGRKNVLDVHLPGSVSGADTIR